MTMWSATRLYKNTHTQLHPPAPPLLRAQSSSIDSSDEAHRLISEADIMADYCFRFASCSARSAFACCSFASISGVTADTALALERSGAIV